MFLGAGCSVSSGIPAAAELVQNDWLPKLRDLRSPSEQDVVSWAAAQFESYTEDTAAAYYGRVLEELFLTPVDRQREIERLCDGRLPGFGYGVLAQLVALPGGPFNVVLTTNFDDLAADALYLFTDRRPLVIAHERLFTYIRASRTRPLIIKLHGDHRLEPHNTPSETATLDGVSEMLPVLHDRGLVFLGYGGHDTGVLKILQSLPSEALPHGVYWVAPHEPPGEMAEWLNRRGGVFVHSRDFDELMLLVHHDFGFAPPSRAKIDSVFDNYEQTFVGLAQQLKTVANATSQDPGISEAITAVSKSFPDWHAVHVEASTYRQSDPERAKGIYKRGMAAFPQSFELAGNYANMLAALGRSDEAIQEYRNAIKLNPSAAKNWSNLGLELWRTHDLNGARQAFQQGETLNEDDPEILNTLAFFADKQDNDTDKAEELYRQALAIAPYRSDIRARFASLLAERRQDMAAADEQYREAIALLRTGRRRDHAVGLAEPGVLTEYAMFLWKQRQELDRAESMFRRAVAADDTNPYSNALFAQFLIEFGRGGEGREYIERAVELAPQDANILGLFANYKHVQGDLDGAEQVYRDALELNVGNLANLVNLAGLLLARDGSSDEGRVLLARAEADAADSSDPAVLADMWFYEYVYGKEDSRLEALRRLKKAITAGGRSPSWDYGAHVRYADEVGHPRAEWIFTLSKVLRGDAEPKALLAWSEFNAA